MTDPTDRTDERPDARLVEALEARAGRGAPRGADALYGAAAASRPSLVDHSRLWLVAAAAVLLIVAGAVFALGGDDGGPEISDLAMGERWQSNFDEAEPDAGLGSDYSVSTFGSGAEISRWSGGWQADVIRTDAGGTTDGVAISPLVTAVIGDKLTIDAELAVGLEGIAGPSGSSGWVEIVITTAPGLDEGFPFAVDSAPGAYAIGCRLEPQGNTICTLNDDGEDRGVDRRLWQASFFEMAGTESFGGFEAVDDGRAITRCSEPAPSCLDRWTMTVTPTSIRLDLNGERYFEQAGLPPLPEAFTSAPVRVHVATITSRHPDPTVTFLGGAIAIESG